MKFSWKIFFATMILTLLTFGAGGCFLISALFQSAYERELVNAGKENQMLQYSFLTFYGTSARDAMSLEEEDVWETARELSGSMKGSPVSFRLTRASDGEILYENEKSHLEQEILKSVETDSRSSMLQRDGETYWLQTASQISVGNDSLYLESFRDISGLFADRERQFEIYRIWMTVLVIVQSIFSYVTALWLLRPLRRLSRASKRIGGGDLSVRAKVESQDEIGDLAAEFNRMADHLEEQIGELYDAARRQEDFIGSFAHELKTPMTSMIGYADMLLTQDLNEEERFQAASYIFKEGRRLESLSHKMMELLVVKNQELEKKPVSIRYMIEDIRGMMAPVLKKQGISLKAAAEEETLFLEPDLFKTVILNLIDNGRKAIDGEGTIWLLGRREEEKYCLYVRDTGKGIQKEELARITEAFYMVDKSRARKQGGAGLGLAICTEIVARHGGTMNFQSKVGKGTVVRICLPMEEEVRP